MKTRPRGSAAQDGNTGSGMVDRYIGSSFDIVYAVYKQLPTYPKLVTFANDWLDKVDDVDKRNTIIEEKYESILLANDQSIQAIAQTLTYRDETFLASNNAKGYQELAETAAIIATEQKDLAIGAKEEASLQATASSDSATLSDQRAIAAANSATTATQQATLAGIHATAALQSKESATGSATEAGEAAVVAGEQAGIATTKAQESSNSATTATNQAQIATDKAAEAVQAVEYIDGVIDDIVFPNQVPPYQLLASSTRWAALRGRNEPPLTGPIPFTTVTNSQAGRLTFRSPYSGDNPLLLCIYIGGVDGNTDLAIPSVYADTINDGVLWARCNFSGNSYGSPTAMQDVRDVYNQACALAPIGGVVFVANSMGAIVALNALTNAVVPGILGVYVTDPVTNLRQRYDGSRQQMIKDAYGIAADGSDYVEKTAGYDPNLRNWSTFKGVPIHIIGSTGDTTVPFGSNGQALAAKLSGHSDVTLVTRTSAGHGSPDRFDVGLLRAFLRKVAGISIGSTPPASVLAASDSFNRDGALFGSSTDNYLGEPGTVKVWGGTAGNNVLTSTAGGGQLTLGSTVVFSQCIDVGSSDVEMKFKLIQGPVTVSGFHSMVDLRKETAGTGNVMRMVLHSYDAVTGITKAQLCKRVGGTGTLLGSEFEIEDGQVIKLTLKGNEYKVFADDVLKQEVTDTSVPTGMFCGFSGSSSNKPWIISELSLTVI